MKLYNNKNKDGGAIGKKRRGYKMRMTQLLAMAEDAKEVEKLKEENERLWDIVDETIALLEEIIKGIEGKEKYKDVIMTAIDIKDVIETEKKYAGYEDYKDYK